MAMTHLFILLHCVLACSSAATFGREGDSHDYDGISGVEDLNSTVNPTLNYTLSPIPDHGHEIHSMNASLNKSTPGYPPQSNDAGSHTNQT